MKKIIPVLCLLSILFVGCHSESSTSLLGYEKVTSTRYTYHDIKKDSFTKTLNSVGAQKMLVVPVEFIDYTAHMIDENQGDSLKQDIQKAFFGDATETGWESVSSFYEKSSYGKLSITGEVTDWLSLNIYAGELTTKTNYPDPTYYVVEQFYLQADAALLQEYDQDKDGDIDAIAFIYALPARAINGDVFWGYAFWYSDIPDTTKPIVGNYFWASYDFMYEGYGNEVIDAHTYIHETGHMLGLDDYYNYDTESEIGPAGQLDMMDRGVLDHNAFSKMALGWTLPTYITGEVNEVNVTLKPFESSGDFILIKNQWNGTPFDEYLLLEFYTPTGLNEKDSEPSGYAGASYIRGFSIPGIKIYHIDARLVYGGNSYIDSIDDTIIGNVMVGQTNTPSTSSEPNQYLVHLLEATNVFSFKNGARANNNTLFVEGMSFVGDKTFFKNDTYFNDATKIGYQIDIGVITDTEAHITVKKL